MGTPDFAVPTLSSLAGSFSVVGVITQPDRPTGRGRKLTPPPIKITAQELGLEVYQPVNINQESAHEKIKTWHPDLICVAAFGQILSQDLLTLPRYGCLNVHASLLPRWRGASPINAAILHGDTNSGVTIIKMSPGLDDGPILTQRSFDILSDETAGTLSDRLAAAGAELLLETIPAYVEGKIKLQPQDSSLATYAPLLKKQSGQLDFNLSARSLTLKVRAYSPWPGTFTFWKGTRLIIHKTTTAAVTSPGPGVFTRYEGSPAIGTGEGILILDLLQLAGKKTASGKIFLNGTPDWEES